MTSTELRGEYENSRWADPILSAERAKLAAMLARACRRSGGWAAFSVISAEMADLHLDVTERAATPLDRRPHAFDRDPDQPAYATEDGYCVCGWQRDARVHQVAGVA